MADMPYANPSLSPVIATVLRQSSTVLKTYEVDPGLVQEHANGERRITQGGYGERQLFELVQNAADEIAAQPNGKLHVILTEDHLYCANEGDPVTPEGAETILRMSVSRKRGGQIGRFGVGVKSVLSVCDSPQFFSGQKDGIRFGFGFDRKWSAAEIARAVGLPDDSDMDTPVLRMARPLDVDQERADDSVLDKLLGWAVTVVRLPLLPGAAERLGRDISGHKSRNGRETDAFPAHFQLFSSHVGQVLLHDERAMPRARREISIERKGSHRTLKEVARGTKQTTEQWRVFSVAHTPTGEAADSAGELHDRPELEISWAVPDYTVRNGLYTVPVGRGRFWAFFPTKYEVSLTGILNAPWKTNEDRQHLLDGSPFNRELLEAAAELVIDTLPGLMPAEDPAAYLPLLPGRTKERLNWADEHFVRRVWEMAARSPSLPDQDCQLQIPRDLLITPSNLDKEWVQIWSEYSGRPTNWVHPSVDASDLRRGKMTHILDAAGKTPERVKDWLEALVSDGSAEASSHAIEILSLMVAKDQAGRLRGDSPLTAEARTARIILTEKHGVVAPVAGEIFHRTSADTLRDDMVYVHPSISERPEMARHLHNIGIRVADAQGRFEGVLDQGFDHYDNNAWSNFWVLLRSAGGSLQVDRVRAKVPKPLETLRVRTVDGRYRPMRDCLLPGPVVPADGSRDKAIAVDLDFHESDKSVFRDIGLFDRPTGGYRPHDEPWFQEYRQVIHDAHLRGLASTAPRSSIARLTIEGAPTLGPLHLLPALSEEGRAAFVSALPASDISQHWQMQYGSVANTRKAVISPLRWMINRHGLVKTSMGLTRVSEAVGPQLKSFRAVLPVAEIPEETARRLHIPTTADEVPTRRWGKLLDLLLVSEDDAFIGRAYALLHRVSYEFPEGLLTRCRVGSSWEGRPDNEIAVAVNTTEFKELVRERLPALLVTDKADVATAKAMIEDWGMLKVSDVISREIDLVKAGPATSLFEEFPTVKARLGQAGSSHKIQRCSQLEQVMQTPMGSKRKPLTFARKGQGQTLFVLDSLDRLQVLQAADEEFKWGWGVAGCSQALALQDKQEHDQTLLNRLRAVREAESVIDKIDLLIGEEALRGKLPPGLMESEIHEQGAEPSSRRIAEMAFNAHGESILRIHWRDLSLDFPTRAPASFTGSSKALLFVTNLGFPDSFAGAQVPSLEPRLEVDGPVEFPALHPYQEELAQALLGLLNSPTPQRGMLSLPTGAGKTRVTAEGVIRWIRDRTNLPGPILWIAQTEELCEQAVQSWKFVWSKVGPEHPLVISRLWSSKEATPVDGRPHLVVATDAKLDSCMTDENYDWLRETASLVIIDEAHTGMSKRYTRLLEQLELTHHRTRRHLIGLTATPYKNNAELTRLLVQRFGSRLDTGVFDGDLSVAIKGLQEIGVLAQVKHRELQGAAIALTADERAQSEKFATLPKGAEQRLAEDHGRSQRIVDEIAAMPSDWPVLVFATSVAHAKLLAAKLGDREIKAAAIDSTTPTNERRKQIDDFRKGRIQVLTNYGVLTQGFDAPATRAVVVARPTYSPNMYQQMIGRGLRGPKNGGKESCLILNVRDNITNYGEELAFTEFEYLWNGDQ